MAAIAQGGHIFNNPAGACAPADPESGVDSIRGVGVAKGFMGSQLDELVADFRSRCDTLEHLRPDGYPDGF